MFHPSDIFGFTWLEGSRTFAIVFGAVTSAACLSLAVPMLLWYLPNTRRRFFPESVDPKQSFQFAFGILCMSMAFADALCRFIPHRPLGFVHPTFFLTTVALVLLLGPRVASMLLERPLVRMRVPPAILAGGLVVLVAFPIAVVVNAFWF